MLLLSPSSSSSSSSRYLSSLASGTMVGVDVEYCRPWASDDDSTMKSKSKDSIVGEEDKDLEDDPDSDSQSSFHDNESDAESQPEQQTQSQQQKQQQQQQQSSLPPPPPPPPPPPLERQSPPKQSLEVDDTQIKGKCKTLSALSPTPASPVKDSPSREMAPSPLRRSSVITEGSLAQTSVALPPTTPSTASVSVITRTTSHSTHTVTPSKQNIRDRYKVLNGAYRSFFTESNHCSTNSHNTSNTKTNSHHANLHHHLTSSSTITTTTTATTTTSTIINNHKSHHNNNISNNNSNSNKTANNDAVDDDDNNNSDQPLDLSKKSKSKSQTPPPRVTNGISNSSGGLSSSLKSLQQRFGGDFHINGTNLRANKSIEDQVGMSQISLNNFASSQLVNRNITEYGSNVNVDLNAALKGSNNNSLINRVVKPQTDLCTEGMNSRYTTHRCSCQKVFSSLYDLSLHLQETHHIPAGSKDANVMEYPKLVRGQDMWLNQESEQTRRILRCMQCGESFKTLPELTLHMMQTQHYTKIVSSDHGRRSHKCSSYCDRDLEKECIFKCKVCQETYSDMEGLANHMIMSGHHKKQILRSYNSPEILLRARRKRPFSSEDKPGLGANPTVATLLEFKRKCVSHDGLNSPSLKYTDVVTKEDDGYITCENCGKCIEMRMFVEHVRTCVRQRSGVIDALKMKLNADDDLHRVKKSEEPSSVMNHIQSSHQSSNSVEYDLSKVKKEPKDVDEKIEVSMEIPICSPSKVEPASKELDSSTPEMKVIPEKMQVCSPEDDDSTSSNVRKDSDRMLLDIIDPDNNSSVGGLSALRAMESFIQKSFKNKFDKNSHKDSSSSGSVTSVTQELKQIATPDSPTKYLQVSNQSKVASKPSSSLQNVPSCKPLLCKESIDECSEAEAEKPFKSSGKELQSLSDMCEQITKQTTVTAVVKVEEKSSSSLENQDEVPSSPMSVSEKKPSKEPLEEKYLQLPPTTESDPSKSSALDSLSSFVYGQPMTCEHPLDSLQKLITNTDPIKMPSHSSQPSKCQTITSSSSPDISIPLNLSTKCQKDDEPEKSGREDLSGSNNSTDAAHGEMTSPASDSDSGDYKCPACSRQCASKGSCRYHLSRCHLSSVKKFSIRDPFSMSPFVYLPLDHTAKFTKYYEMAHELANKSSVSHELTAKGK